MTSRFLTRLFAAGATSMALMATGAAHAGTYELQFTGTDIAGSFLATTNAAHLITSITGAFTDTDPGLGATSFSITGSSPYAAADNKLFGTPSYVTFSGISVTTNAGAGNDFNLFDNGGGRYYLLAQRTDPGGGTYTGMPELNLNVTAVAEPASAVLLLAGGLGLIGLARRRRAR
jgi:hypothetical protein